MRPIPSGGVYKSKNGEEIVAYGPTQQEGQLKSAGEKGGGIRDLLISLAVQKRRTISAIKARRKSNRKKEKR